MFAKPFVCRSYSYVVAFYLHIHLFMVSDKDYLGKNYISWHGVIDFRYPFRTFAAKSSLRMQYSGHSCII